MDSEACHAAIHGVAKSRHDWTTELNWDSHLPESPLLHKAVSNIVKTNFFSTLKANQNYATTQGTFNKEKYVKRIIYHNEVWFISHLIKRWQTPNHEDLILCFHLKVLDF